MLAVFQRICAHRDSSQQESSRSHQSEQSGCDCCKEPAASVAHRMIRNRLGSAHPWAALPGHRRRPARAYCQKYAAEPFGPRQASVFRLNDDRGSDPAINHGHSFTRIHPERVVASDLSLGPAHIADKIIKIAGPASPTAAACSALITSSPPNCSPSPASSPWQYCTHPVSQVSRLSHGSRLAENTRCRRQGSG